MRRLTRRRRVVTRKMGPRGVSTPSLTWSVRFTRYHVDGEWVPTISPGAKRCLGHLQETKGSRPRRIAVRIEQMKGAIRDYVRRAWCIAEAARVVHRWERRALISDSISVVGRSAWPWDTSVWTVRWQPITECHGAKSARLKELQGRFLTPKSEQTARRCHRQAVGEAARVVSRPGEAVPGDGETTPWSMRLVAASRRGRASGVGYPSELSCTMP